MDNSIKIEDMNPEQSLEEIWNLINRAASKGAFTIDESYVIKVLFSKISHSIKKIEKESDN